jgi:hypothetical protein
LVKVNDRKAGQGKAKLKADNPSRVVFDDFGDGTYLELSGTSTAAAMVSGAVALMLDKNPSLIPDSDSLVESVSINVWVSQE